jgi:hypothetical protein
MPLAGFEVSLIRRFSGVPRGQARMRESNALREYRRTLQIYTEIILHGKGAGGSKILSVI